MKLTLHEQEDARAEDLLRCDGEDEGQRNQDSTSAGDSRPYTFLLRGDEDNDDNDEHNERQHFVQGFNGISLVMIRTRAMDISILSTYHIGHTLRNVPAFLLQLHNVHDHLV